jgi:hypothetical protein
VHPLCSAIWLAARGTAPTCETPAPLDPAFLEDIVRPPLPPAVRNEFIQSTVAAILVDLFGVNGDRTGSRPDQVAEGHE